MALNCQSTSKNDLKSVNTGENTNSAIPGFSTIEEFTKDGFKTLIEATKNSNSLPQDRDWDFYNTHESFRNLMSSEGDNILLLINDVLKQQGVRGNIKSRDFEEKIELIIEANDIILERVANNLDELAGIRKKTDIPVEIQTVSAELPISGSWNKINNAKITVSSSTSNLSQNIPSSPNSVHLLTAKNIQRPQKFFKDKIDNSKAPWEPKIKDKPNNLKPLAIFLEETEDGLGEIFCQPYEFELERFTPPSHQLARVSPVLPPKQLSLTPLHIVDTKKSLDRLLETLRQHKEIAVDLEHHSYRSYLGFTCLMQISTPEEDFLIDTLALRDKLWILNEVFTKPTILKVFHGADHDIEWLQRDLSLYVVNMFDTYQAAKQLGYPQLSLAYLLRRFCHLDPNKRFQLADWRIRPLPEELKAYARDDTHFLLYIANLMRNELLQKGENVLRQVYTSSTQVCLKRYSKPIINEDSHLVLYRKCKKLFDNRQMYALKHLFQWRDALAREEDESTGYILPNHMLLQISELLPREMQGILACCNPIPPLVRSNLLELHRIVLKAREQSINKPIFSEEARSRGATHQNTAKINVDSMLNCPHDVGKEEFRDDLPTLLGKGINKKGNFNHGSASENQIAKLNIFESPENSDSEKEKKNRINSKMQRMKFLGPYERYKLVKKYVQEEKKQEEDKQKEKPEERTDTDRIEALHEHFKTLAAATDQIPPTAEQPNNTTATINDIHPITLGQPIGKKRKRDNEENTDNNYLPSPNTSKHSPDKKKNKKKKNMQTFNEQLHQGKKKNKQNSSPKGEKRKWNEEQNKGSKKRRENNDDFRPFDYSSVDFQQFQGGAGSVNQGKKVASNFRGKGQKNKKFDNIGKNNNKSSTFRGRDRSRKGGGSW